MDNFGRNLRKYRNDFESVMLPRTWRNLKDKFPKISVNCEETVKKSYKSFGEMCDIFHTSFKIILAGYDIFNYTTHTANLVAKEHKCKKSYRNFEEIEEILRINF